MLPRDVYRSIYTVMPIACVDLLIMNPAQEVLLVKRSNEPAVGQWWLPGGRVHYGERRAQAAVRKLNAEVGLVASDPTEILTEDLFFSAEIDAPRHVITTVFLFRVTDGERLKLDGQSETAEWRMPESWFRNDLHAFVRRVLDFARSST